MYEEVAARGKGPTADVKAYSPVTLTNEWPKIARLSFVLFCSCFGTTMNGFFVASFFVEKLLNKIGNVFLCCLGLADLIITTVVMPTCVVILLSGQWDTVEVCNVLQLLTEISTYSYSLLALLVAAESYFRLCRTVGAYETFMLMRVAIVVPLIYAISAVLATIGVYYKLDYDFCEREHHGNFYFRLSTDVIFHGIPCALTLYALITTSLQVQERARNQVQYKRSMQYKRDYSITNLNITSYILFVISWIPYLVIVYKFPNASNGAFYHLTWLALLRSVVTTFLYGTMNTYFRRAFAHIFNYCCCKSSLSSSLNSRHRRALEYKSATGEVRVHIMHRVVSGGHLRGASCETQEL